MYNKLLQKIVIGDGKVIDCEGIEIDSDLLAQDIDSTAFDVMDLYQVILGEEDMEELVKEVESSKGLMELFDIILVVMTLPEKEDEVKAIIEAEGLSDYRILTGYVLV